MRTLTVTLMAALAAVLLLRDGVVSAEAFTIDSLEADGSWCPMAHCNRYDDSFQRVKPLLSVGAVQKVADPRVSPIASNLLGCVTGKTMAVCAYDSTAFPAVAAFDYADGTVRWTSPAGDLPEPEGETPTGGRNTAGILLAKMGVNGNPPRRYVFTGNRVEFVAYAAENGQRVWKRANKQITVAAPEGVGHPVSMAFSDDRELVAVTTRGWIIKLNPVNGSTIDAYRLHTQVVVDGVLYAGTFHNRNTPVVIGNILYAVVGFAPDTPEALPENLRPVHVIRVQLSQPHKPGFERKIRPIATPGAPMDPTPDRQAIGVGDPGGSPPAMIRGDGNVLLFADSEAASDGQLWPSVSAVEDHSGQLRLRWRAILRDQADDDIVAAPALHAKSRTLIVSTKEHLYVFSGVDELHGNATPPEPLRYSKVFACKLGYVPQEIGAASPVTLAFNRGTNEIVAYTNFRVRRSAAEETFAYLGAFATTSKAPIRARPLWCVPIGDDDGGVTLPSRGTYGQAAQFLTGTEGEKLPNLIFNTVSDGTYIVRSMTETTPMIKDIAAGVRNTATAVELMAQGYELVEGVTLWPQGCGEGEPGCLRYVNNPITRYGQAALPVGPGGDLKAKLQLDGKDALAIYGMTPAPITYFSHTMNQFRHFYPHINDYFDTVSSISLSINQSNINTLGGVHGRFFALVVAPDHAVAVKVQRALVEADIPEAAISRILIPARFANKDITAVPDELTFVTRLTYREPEEKQLVEDYIAQSQSNSRVLLFDAPGGYGDVLDEHLPRWEEYRRVNASEENAGADVGLELLMDRIIGSHQAEGYTLGAIGREVLQHIDPQLQCRDVPQSCNFDAPDALYGRFYCSFAPAETCRHLLPDYQGFFVIAGVNHHRYAQDTLGTYFSYAVTRMGDLAGVATLTDLQTVGSAARYLQGSQLDPADFFAIKIARDCNGEPYCLEVPWGAEVGIPQFDPFMVTARIYLDRVMGTAPNPENFVPARILSFTR